MQITWKLRMAAAQREVWTGAQLQRLLAEKAGIGAVLGVGVGVVHQAAQPDQAVHPDRVVHRPGVHPRTICSTSTPPLSHNRSRRSRPRLR